MELTKISLPIETGYSLRAACATPSGDILAVIDNYNPIFGNAATTKIIRLSSSNPTIQWEFSRAGYFDSHRLEVGPSGDFVFVGQKSGYNYNLSPRDFANQTVLGFNSLGVLSQEFEISGDGNENVTDIQISKQGTAWITLVSDSSSTLGSQNYNSKAPINPFDKTTPDNSIGDDVLIVRASLQNGSRNFYRIGNESADYSSGGRVDNTSDTFIANISSNAALAPKVNGLQITFESPYVNAPSSGNRRLYYYLISQDQDKKAYYLAAPFDAIRYVKSQFLGGEIYEDSRDYSEKIISRPPMLSGSNYAETVNTLFVDKLSNLNGTAYESLVKSTDVYSVESNWKAYYSTIPDSNKVKLYGSEYEFVNGYSISASSKGELFLFGDLLRDSDDRKQLIKATPSPEQAVAPTFVISISSLSSSEGSKLDTTVSTFNIASGISLYYILSGTGISSDDLSAGTLTGSGTVGTDGKFSFSHTLANDLTTEGSETLQIKLFSDSARTIQVGSTASVTIADTSTTPIERIQSLSLTAPSKSALRSGVSATSSIAYNVSTGDTALTGIGASLFFDSSQLTVATAGDPFQKGLIGNTITADTNNADGDPKTDKLLALSYTDFSGNFPGTGTTLPLTLANLNLVPTSAYTGTTLHLKGSNPSTGFTTTGADLTLSYNAAPVVASTPLPTRTINRGSAFSYTLPTTLFSDTDSTLTLSASTATGSPLPSWLSFNPSTGTFSGTPTTGGTLNLAVSAADELGSVSAPLTIKVREVQSLASSSSQLRYQRGKDVTVPIHYTTTDASSTTGLSFKVHFNSSLFSFDPTKGIANKAQADLFQVGAVEHDTANSDNDASTDKFIPIVISSFSGNFPSAALPIKLADLTFTAADKPIDPLTGLKDTSINFSETEAATGYGFLSSAAALKPLSFSLDVDGDGKVTALGDGLMVIRHLFGAAFAGSALTDKAISPDSALLGGVAYTSMTAQQKATVASQVAANIQQGIDAGLLDIDKDGKTNALGDGLMVIRRLFGPAFAGSALTDKAISPTSPHLNNAIYNEMAAAQKSQVASLVAANIDALNPTLNTPVI